MQKVTELKNLLVAAEAEEKNTNEGIIAFIADGLVSSCSETRQETLRGFKNMLGYDNAEQFKPLLGLLIAMAASDADLHGEARNALGYFGEWKKSREAKEYTKSKINQVLENNKKGSSTGCANIKRVVLDILAANK